MKEYIDSGCIDIIGATFRRGLSETRDKEEIKRRIDFVNKGELFELWCLITDSDINRLRRLTLVRNHKFFKNI